MRISATRQNLICCRSDCRSTLTPLRNAEKKISIVALQHYSITAAWQPKKGKYGALDPSQFVAHLELAELELTQHDATQGEGTMIGIGIVLVAAIASFYVLRIVNEN